MVFRRHLFGIWKRGDNYIKARGYAALLPLLVFICLLTIIMQFKVLLQEKITSKFKNFIAPDERFIY